MALIPTLFLPGPSGQMPGAAIRITEYLPWAVCVLTINLKKKNCQKTKNAVYLEELPDAASSCAAPALVA